jgi:hypothetical protein
MVIFVALVRAVRDAAVVDSTRARAIDLVEHLAHAPDAQQRRVVYDQRHALAAEEPALAKALAPWGSLVGNLLDRFELDR